MVSLRRSEILICISFIFVLTGQVWSARKCGKASFLTSAEKNVTEGEDAEQGVWPWMVALMKTNEKGTPEFLCTGYLIDKKHVLTSANFFEGNDTSPYSARIGHVNLQMGKTYSIKNIAFPDGYKRGLFYHNIALLTLSKEVDEPNFNPVCLPPPRSLVNLRGRSTTFVGWGLYRRGDVVIDPTLKQLSDIPILPNTECSKAYNENFNGLLPEGMNSAMVCAGYQNETGFESCPGEFGGPLMIQEQNRWYAIGMVSLGGEMCGHPNFPTVYTRTSEYINWINELTNSKPNVTPGRLPASITGVKPGIDVDGVRFGKTKYSRQEFTKDSEFIDSLLDDSVFRLEFKTNGSSGVLFYADGVTPHRDYIGLFMKDGRITHVINCGSGPAVMTTNKTYNDGKWHRVVFSRQYRQGRLIMVEEKEDVRGSLSGPSIRMVVKPTFFVGGLSQEAAEQSKAYLMGVDSSFPGCIRNVEAQGELWTSKDQSAVYDTASCSSTTEGLDSTREAENDRRATKPIQTSTTETTCPGNAECNFGINQNCGMAFSRSLTRPKRMVGGEDTEQGEWPWMVAIMVQNREGQNSPWCTGFLVDKKHIISAAQCFEEPNFTYSARIGSVDSNQGPEYPISEIVIHNRYRKGEFYHDIAVLKLASEVRLDSFNPVCLPPQGSQKVLTGKRATLLSWGATKQGGPMSASLKQLREMPILPSSICDEAYGRRFRNTLPQGITNGMLCAGFQGVENKGLCGSDAGGLLMIEEEDRWYAAGVVSFGYLCGSPDYPGVYTRVSEYTSWINEVTRNRA